MIKVIGLTGGIGSGKSTISNYLKSKGLEIIDCDEMSRNLTKKNGEALPDIRRAFGVSVFNDNGELDRKALANIVFNDKNELNKLEKITTDIVVKKVEKIVNEAHNSATNGIVIIDAPLLFECKVNELCDETWLVTCNHETKIKRIILRDKTSIKEIEDRIKNQMSEAEKAKLADVIIDNSYDLQSLYNNLDKVLEAELDI